MSVIGGGPPSVTKGQLVALRGSGQKITSHTKTFMFNPNNVNDTKGTSWPTVEIPGASHPVYQFGAGGERLISFDLYVDGDRGRLAKLPKIWNYQVWQQQVAGGPKILPQGQGLSITDELVFYRSLVHPVGYAQSPAQVYPSTCTFSMGELYKSVPVIVKKADWHIHYWTPDMRPVRATIAIILGESPSKSVIADDMLAIGGITF